jgi:hypothetical protein
MEFQDWVGTPHLGRAIRTMPRCSIVSLLAAVFFLFSSLGFILDIVRLGRDPLARVVFEAIVSGALAVGYFYGLARGARRNWPILLATLAAQVGIILFGEHLPFGPSLSLEAVTRPNLQARLVVDGTAIVIVVMLGYAGFVAFTDREMRRYLEATTEIALAREIHGVLVPPVSARLDGWELAGLSAPSGEVGGDVVDLVTFEDGRWMAYVADVSGHGVSAGVLMGMAKSAVRMRLRGPWTLAGLVRDLNDTLVPLKKPDMFVTLAAVAGDPDGRFQTSLAGHLPILHYRAEPRTVTRIGDGGVALGLFPGLSYSSSAVRCEPGDVVVLVTDGLTEVVDRADNDFGLDGVERHLTAHAHRSAADIVQRIVAASRAHGAQFDDQTLLVVRRVEGPAAPSEAGAGA